MITDNADDLDIDTSKYFPPGDRGHILITTRSPRATMLATVDNFHFHGMDPEEAAMLLLKSADMYPMNDHSSLGRHHAASSIASELGYLALALAFAGAAIRRNIYTLERFLRAYLGPRKRTLSLPQIHRAENANIITTWEIPLERIAKRKSQSHQDAIDLLHVFAFMHFQSVPEQIFRLASLDNFSTL